VEFLIVAIDNLAIDVVVVDVVVVMDCKLINN
jgi:hypothetical protein